MLESMSLPERLRSMAAQVARNDLSGATTRRLIELDMLEAANLLDTLPASTPPGDPCVRHACKRVRMEMQARIDALAEALLTDAQCDRIIDSLDSLAQDVCQYEYGLPVYDHMPAMRAAIRAAIKGDSHAKV